MDGTRSFNIKQTGKLVPDARSTTQENEDTSVDVKTSELTALITQALKRLEEFTAVRMCVRRWVSEAGYHYRSCVSANNILTVSYAEDFMGEKKQLLIAIPVSYKDLLPPDHDW